MNINQYKVLGALLEAPFSSQRTLAKACGLSLGGVNAALKALQGAGFLDEGYGLTPGALETSPGWAAREQGVPLCVDRLLESAWLCPSPATSLLNRSGLVCPPTGAESLTQDWGDSHPARLAWPVV